MNEQEKQATVTALRLLAATPKSKKRLRQKLEEKGYGLQTIEDVLVRLEKQGILNDGSLAQSLLQTYSLYRPSGRKRIAFEMEKRGVEQRIIEESLGNYGLREEHKVAMELAKTKLHRWQKLEAAQQRKKLYDFLIRRGFDFSVTREIVEQIEGLK